MRINLVQLMRPCFDIELPAVPGTRHDAAGEFSLAERAAGVGANAIERVERAVDVVERNELLAGDELAPFARGNLSGLTDGVPHGRG